MWCVMTLDFFFQTATVAPEVVYYSPHRLHRHGFEDVSPTRRVHGKAPEEQTKQMVTA